MTAARCQVAWAAEDATKTDQPQAANLPRVRVAVDGHGFVLAENGQSFMPWGFNYGKPGQLLEDFWEAQWPEVEADFQEMKALGAKVVRVHLQVNKFMRGPGETNDQALDRLGRLLEVAERTGLYLDVTGLGCYRPADVPPWYDTLSEADRWAAHARFWEAVAERCAPSPAVFCYDLMNEPISPAGRREDKQWYSGKLFGGFDFIQYISLTPGDRSRDEVARQWIKTLVAAIRKHDRQTLVTVGLLPTVPKWGHLSGFIPEKVAPELDFVSVHIYPETGKTDAALAVAREFAVGKPLVIEETFPLRCSHSDLEDFLRRSRGIACGWVGHYDGRSVQELQTMRDRRTLDLGGAIDLEWLKLFERIGPEMLSRPSPTRVSPKVNLDP